MSGLPARIRIHPCNGDAAARDEGYGGRAHPPFAARRRLPLAGHAAYTRPMRIVGTADRSEIELDPVKAYRRGLVLDSMLAAAAPIRVRGVMRGTHADFNRIDADRQLQAARRLNGR
jgi:hypothetical protein